MNVTCLNVKVVIIYVRIYSRIWHKNITNLNGERKVKGTISNPGLGTKKPKGQQYDRQERRWRNEYTRVKFNNKENLQKDIVSRGLRCEVSNFTGKQHKLTITYIKSKDWSSIRGDLGLRLMSDTESVTRSRTPTILFHLYQERELDACQTSLLSLLRLILFAILSSFIPW